MPRRIHAEAERVAEPIELLASGLGSDSISIERVGTDAELAGDELYASGEGRLALLLGLTDTGCL